MIKKLLATLSLACASLGAAGASAQYQAPGDAPSLSGAWARALNDAQAWKISHRNPPDSRKPILQQFDDATSHLIEETLPGVVVIERSVESRNVWSGKTTQEKSSGSGWIVKAKPGAIWVVTNAHVVGESDSSKLAVLTAKGVPIKGQVTVLGNASPEVDLALLEVSGSCPACRTLPMGDSENLKDGISVMAFGEPMGFANTKTRGILSAQNRPLQALEPEGKQEEIVDDFFQTDAAINPGNSGGPLVNRLGEVIGVNTMIISRSGGSQGLGFAIPVHWVKDLLARYEKTGRFGRPYSRIGVALLADPANDQTVVVSAVAPGLPAAQAGFKPGDRILSLGGKPVASIAYFRRKVALSAPGSRLNVRVFRPATGETKDIVVTTVDKTPKRDFFNPW